MGSSDGQLGDDMLLGKEERTMVDRIDGIIDDGIAVGS